MSKYEQIRKGGNGTHETSEISRPENIQEALIDEGQVISRLWTEFEIIAKKLQTFGNTFGFKVKELVENVGRYGTRGGEIQNLYRKLRQSAKEYDIKGYHEALIKSDTEISVIQRLVDAIGRGEITAIENEMEGINEFLANMREGIANLHAFLHGGTAVGSIVRKHGMAEAQREPETLRLLGQMEELYNKISDEIAEIRKLLIRAKTAN